MNRPLVMVLLAAPLALTAAAPLTARDRNTVPPARLIGPPQDCVPIRQLGNSEIRNDHVIDFIRFGRRGYRVTLDTPCPGLAFDNAFSYQTSQSQLCRQDIITVQRQMAGGLMQGASCGLGPFQPIELQKRR